MEDLKGLVVIIPVHEFNDSVKSMLENAIASVPKGIEIRISCKKGIKDDIEKGIKKNKNIVYYEKDDDASDFCSLVNYAVKGSEYFSILEFDDTFSPIWFDVFKQYKDFFSDVSIYLPLNDLVDASNNNKYAGVGNEAPWASSFSNEIGYIDNDCLQNFFDFYMPGGIFRTADFIEVGMLKPSIKLTFWYEFLLRFTSKGKKIYVIPKIGYTHVLGREGSIFDSYKNNISPEESEWWVKLAKKEFHFKEERPEKAIYRPEESEDDE